MKTFPKVLLAVLGILLCALPAFAALMDVAAGSPPDVALVAPPEPPVRPEIVRPVDLDKDMSGVDDRLEARLRNARASVAGARTSLQRATLTKSLDELVQVELVFSEQITQKQIDDFRALGGQIDYIYTNVSYGWNATIPLKLAESLPRQMGGSLVAVVAGSSASLCMDEATRCGRVRPAWDANFAGNSSGFSGGGSTTIAIVDTGLDGTHTDFQSRQIYWHDYTTDHESSPIDNVGHGTHVAGIALGSGAAGGTNSQLLFTDSGDLATVPGGSYYPSPIHIPSGLASTFSSTATWIGGGPTTLYHLGGPNGSSSPGNMGSSAGASPLSRTASFTSTPGYHYTEGLAQNSTPTQPVGPFVVVNTVTYAPVGDGFNTFRGVAPGCKWLGAKIFSNSGTNSSLWTGAALDNMVSKKTLYNIKVVNMSFGTTGSPGLDTVTRGKVNTLVSNGIVPVVSAGNDGNTTSPGGNQIDDPGRAAMAITVAASNDINQLTDYSSVGFSSPDPASDPTVDFKPDLMAPGGSSLYSKIIAPDSNTFDGSFGDQRANDYANMEGTSMSAPFVAGCAALVIQALEQTGLVWWDFGSPSNPTAHPLLVKLLLCATCSESNANRESGGTGGNPTLGRASSPKDLYEGYGMINVDAAIEAVQMTYISGTETGSTAGGPFDRRAWSRNFSVTNGAPVNLALDCPATGDFDLYVYSATPDAKGNPVIVASSCLAGNGTDESISYTPSSTTTQYLVIKRVAGSGTWTMVGSTVADASAPSAPVVIDDGAYTSSTSQIHAAWTATDAQSGIAEYQCAISSTKLESGIIPSGGWTSVGFQAAQTRTGLSLTRGQIYYVLVKARNGVGVWGPVGVADGIVAVQYSPLTAGGAKALRDGLTSGLSAQTVTAKFTDYFYVEDARKSAGMRVHPIDMPPTLAVGQTVDVGGTLQTVGSERRVASACATITVASGTVRPVTLPGRHITGVNWLYDPVTGAGQKGSTASLGLNNIGLLVATCGKVTQIGAGYLYIDDGSGVLDGTLTGSTPNHGLRILCSPTGFASGQYVSATGLSSFFLSGSNLLPAVQVRSQPTDLVRLK